MTQDTALARPDEIPANPLRAVFSPYLWLAGVQLATDWIAAVLGAVAVAAILLAGIIGSPLALLGVPVTRWVITCLNAISGIERTRLALTLGVEIAAPQLPTRVDETWRDSRDLLGGGMLWRQICYWTILLGWSMVTAADLMLALAMPGTFALMPIYYSAAGWPEDLPFSGGSVAWTICALAFAVLFFISPHLIRLGAHLDASLADNLIGPSATGELVQRVGQLESSRARVVDSAEQERRRIERDLHDGAQQRLVSLAMTLGRAKSRLATDTDPATRQLLDEAHAEAKLAITEIRDLTRGLHPPVLTDRGLDAALSAVAARSPVPVQV
ncbi:MAG: sensor histidine kinase, partial [Pseudonocardiales bacterium]